MRLPSEGPMPRHLLNRIHWDPKDRSDGSINIEYGTGLCGARDVMVTKTWTDMTCERCARTQAAQTLGRFGGQAMSERKTVAVRENAKRPRPNARGKHKPRISS